MNTPRKLALLAAMGAISACSSLPERVTELETARAEVRAVEADATAQKVAGNHVEKARNALDAADQAYDEEESLALIRHRAHLAQRHAQIAQQQAAQSRAQQQIEAAEAERTKVQLQARTRQAERAERQAERLAVTAGAAVAAAEELSAELAELKAERTERGLVLTLDDVLFETDKSELRPGAAATMDRLAAFMREYPERRVMVEGHTDARGSDAYNRALSERRALAVQAALVNRGIDPYRIKTRGLGESYPVASNDTRAGMQQNRRVEIVISDDEGEFVAATARE